MTDSKVLEAAKRLRKELIILDQPLMAYNLLVSLNLPELKPEMDRTFSMIRHMFNYDFYKKYHAESLPEFPESEDICLYIYDKWPRYKWMLEKFQQEDIKSVIDLGCSDGAFCLTLANKGYDPIIGVNLNAESLRIAQERVQKFNLKNIHFLQGDLFECQDKADAIIISEVVEHVPDPKKLIDHAASLAIKWIFLTTPNGPFMNGVGNLPQWDLKGADDVRGHVRVYTKKSMEKLLKDYEIGELTEADDGLLHVMYRRKNA